MARPKEDKPYPTVVVIHENRGLNAHIEDVTRRAAQAGFLAIAPNALAPLGGTPENEDEARTKFTQLKPYELYIYEGVNHAFHNNTSAARYNEAAAKLAWKRTVAFFKKHLV